MSSPYTLKISPEEAREMPMVDLAFVVLKAANTPFYYRDLMQEIAKIKGISDNEVSQIIAQLYTEINIDGRFACVGTNLWGLKRWYPLEKAEDPVGNVKRPRIINDEDDDLDDDDLDDEDLFADEGEEDKDFISGGDEEDYDAVDEDSDELFDVEDDEDVVGDEDEDLEDDLEDAEIEDSGDSDAFDELDDDEEEEDQ